VRIRRAANVEAIGIVEVVLVAVGRRIEHRRPVAGLDTYAAQLGVFRRRADEHRDRRGVTQHLLDSGR
jgi:hypothetical protein